MRRGLEWPCDIAVEYQALYTSIQKTLQSIDLTWEGGNVRHHQETPTREVYDFLAN